MATRIISIVNQKGGVGKTTCCLNIGAGLSNEDRRVLYVDADPQGNLSTACGIKTDGQNTLFEVMRGECSTAEAIVKINDHIDILPADLALAAADLSLANEPGKELLIKEALDKVAEDYDYILIDCPPSLGLMTLASLTASGEVFVAMSPEYLPARGLVQLTNTIDIVQKRLNNQVHISGVILNLYDGRRKLHKEAAAAIEAKFPNATFHNRIRNAVAIAEAPAFHQSIFEYRPSSHGAIDFGGLVREILDMEESSHE